MPRLYERELCPVSDTWSMNSQALGPEARRAFSSLSSVFELEGEQITTSTISVVLRLRLDGKVYYVKRYSQAGERLHRFLGRSKARREWINLQRFKDWGLPVAKVVACGEQRLLCFAGRGALITAEVQDSADLAGLEKQQSPLFMSAAWVRR